MNKERIKNNKCSCCIEGVRCGRGYNSERTITIKHIRSQLLYDIGNIGYVEGDVTEEELLHARHTIQDICQSGNIDRVTRIMDLVHGKCADILSPISAGEECEGGEIGDEIEDVTEYSITLKAGPGLGQSTAKLICDIIHELIVSSVLFEWLGIANPKSAEKWGAKQEALLGQLRSIAYRSQMGARRPMNPF